MSVTRPWMQLRILAARLASPDRALRRSAADEARHLIEGLSTTTVAQADHVLRAGSDRDDWAQLEARDLRPLAAVAGGATMVQLAMCHRSGHVREEAIRLSAVISDGHELPFLILRLNDWVDPVRRAAEAAVRARLEAWPASALVVALPLLDQAADHSSHLVASSACACV